MIPTQTTVSDLLRAPIPDAPVGKYPVRILVCGIPDGVNQVIYHLHLLSFAEVGAWSPPLPSPIPGEVIHVLTQYFKP